jgi:branched-chain amino acid transport system substrate-binding protein
MYTKLVGSQFLRRGFGAILCLLVILSMILPEVTAGALETCSDPLGCVTIGPGEPIHIAYSLVISGPTSSLGIDSKNGIQIAIDDSGGKILNHPILFDGVDDACTADGGAAAGATLAADPTIVAVIGTNCSGAARTAMPFLSSAGLAVVSPSNTAPDLTQAGNPNNYPGYLRVSWNDRVQGAAAARLARKTLGSSKVATIIDGTVYSTYMQQTFVTEFQSLGGTITAQIAIDPDQTDLSSELTAIAAGSPDLLYFPVFMPLGGHIVNQARATNGLESTYLMSADSLWTDEIVNATGTNSEGLMITSVDLTNRNPAYPDHFLPAYRAKFGEPVSTFHAHAYDAFMIIKAAIEKAALVSQDGTMQIGRQALRNALYGTTSFPGLTGNLTCSVTGDCADPIVAAYKYHASQFPPVYFWPDFVVTIAGKIMGSYGISANTTLVDDYPSTQNGPVKIGSLQNLPFFTSERVIAGNSFNEVMGYPTNQLTTEYWFPWYDNKDMSTWVLVGNASSTQAAAADIYIGGLKRGSYTIPIGGRIMPRFNLQTGPVRVVSTNGAKIFTSERAVYKGAFNEVMGYPANQFATEYWFPFYDNVGMAAWILVGNPSTTSTAAVDIYIGGIKRGSYAIAKGKQITPRFNINPATGPVRVVSTNGVKIFSSERSLYGDSFNEVMGYPANQFTTEYWYPWYDNVSMYTWVLVGNPSTTASAKVDIYVGTEKYSYNIGAGKQINQRYTGITTGPVRVVSTNGVKVFSSERVLYGTSFNEVMGYPGNKLSTEYWLPWYDSTSMSTDIVVGVP